MEDGICASYYNYEKLFHADWDARKKENDFSPQFNRTMSAFEKITPSVFVVSSPFQALCAMAAINQLGINDYKIIVHFTNVQMRNQQIKFFLKAQGIKYTSYLPNRVTLLYYKYLSFRSQKVRFSRLFIGNHNDYVGLHRGLCCVSDGAHIVYLDDGALSITLFNGDLKERKSNDVISQLESIAKRRNFCFFKNFLSIYDGIPNKSYTISKLNLDCFISNRREKQLGGVVIIGTVLIDICRVYNFTNEQMIKKMEDLILYIKTVHQGEQIYFYPHGRDSHPSETKELFIRCGCVYKTCDYMIETTLMEMELQPVAIYGFTSSALYTLKELFPQTKVVNVVYVPKSFNSVYKEYGGVTQYYQKKGIETYKVII